MCHHKLEEKVIPVCFGAETPLQRKGRAFFCLSVPIKLKQAYTLANYQSNYFLNNLAKNPLVLSSDVAATSSLAYSIAALASINSVWFSIIFRKS